MTKRTYSRIGLAMVAVGVCAAATLAWWGDGAWENGAMPTHGVVTVIVLSASGLLCFLAATWFGRNT